MVRAGFDVDGQDVGPGAGEVAQVALRLLDHQVHIDHGPIALGHRADGLDDERADGDVGHEVAVHHVHVNVIGPGGQGLLDVGLQPGEVGRENRRGEMDGAHG